MHWWKICGRTSPPEIHPQSSASQSYSRYWEWSCPTQKYWNWRAICWNGTFSPNCNNWLKSSISLPSCRNLATKCQRTPCISKNLWVCSCESPNYPPELPAATYGTYLLSTITHLKHSQNSLKIFYKHQMRSFPSSISQTAYARLPISSTWNSIHSKNWSNYRS